MNFRMRVGIGLWSWEIAEKKKNVIYNEKKEAVEEKGQIRAICPPSVWLMIRLCPI